MSGYRTPLARAALVPLVLWLVYAVLRLAALDYYEAVDWLGSPLNATLVVLTLALSFAHMHSGVRVIIEDYVYGHLTKAGALLLNLFICGLAGALAVFSVLKVALGGL
jgi:succinate dehydrogenase / fumarate reductase, membrane anchor subunit